MYWVYKAHNSPTLVRKERAWLRTPCSLSPRTSAPRSPQRAKRRAPLSSACRRAMHLCGAPRGSCQSSQRPWVAAALGAAPRWLHRPPLAAEDTHTRPSSGFRQEQSRRNKAAALFNIIKILSGILRNENKSDRCRKELLYIYNSAYSNLSINYDSQDKQCSSSSSSSFEVVAMSSSPQQTPCVSQGWSGEEGVPGFCAARRED